MLRVLAAAVSCLVVAGAATAQPVPRSPTPRPGSITAPVGVPKALLGDCKLVIQDVVGRIPLDKKRPFFDIMVRNDGKAACGAPPPNSYNFIVIGDYFVETYYKMPVKDGGAAGFYTKKMQAHENNRAIPSFLQSLAPLDALKPGQTTTITVATPNGYCASPDPACVPYRADMMIRVDIRYQSNGKPNISDSFTKTWSVVP